MKLIHSIGAKVLVLTGFAVLVALVVGLSGREAVVGLHSTVKELGILQQGLHNQSEADGANHALQYDVLAAVTATSADERKERLDDLAERYEQLEGLAVTRRLLLGLDDNPADKEKLRQAFAEVDAPLKAYVDAARAVEDALAHDPGAAAGRLQAVDAAQVVFDERFDALTSAITRTPTASRPRPPPTPAATSVAW